MTSSFTLGRVLGIRVGLHWSWLVVFALIAWSLAVSVFPAQNDGLSDGTYVVMAIVAAFLFFVSLLLHELGHAVVARGEGMEIEGITLWLFGGVASFRGRFPSPGAELRIAGAGPVVSLVLGAALVLVAAVVPSPEAVDGVAAWLGFINLALLVFNLLPALPLDGGRILRAALWGARDDFAWATRVSSRIGMGFGYLFIALGVGSAIVLSAFSGIWLAFIGWFLLGAAAAEARDLAVRQALGGVSVRELMVREPAVVAPQLSLGDFMDEVVWNRRHTTYPVVEDGRTVGLLPFRRVAEVPRDDWDGRSVRDCMLPIGDVPMLDPDGSAVDALAELATSGVGRGLVMEDDRLVGLLSITDVARALEIGRSRRR